MRCGVAPSAWIQKEGWGGPLYESAQIRVLATGKIVATTGTHSHGQGHETTFAQLVADQFGVGLDDVEVLHGDSAQGRIARRAKGALHSFGQVEILRTFRQEPGGRLERRFLRSGRFA